MILHSLTSRYLSRRTVPLLLVILLGGFFSMRLLSDPDLGFHLRYGEWIISHHAVPEKDLSTYTVSNHDYIDIHWFFQATLYCLFRIAGYKGISVLVSVITIALLLLLLRRLKILQAGPGLACSGLLTSILIIEPSFGPHPELLSFVFLTASLLVLDLYFHQRKNLLFMLPLIQLLWCNMHGLFILGLFAGIAYCLSIWRRDRKIDRKIVFWVFISTAICLANPYFIKGFLFPFGLATRFNPNNIFNQHIQEFIPFFRQSHFVLRDYLFLSLLISVYILILLTFRKRAFHELLLILVFSLLALVSIRNIPLFVLIAIPVWSVAASELSVRSFAPAGRFVAAGLAVIALLLIPRVATDAWYMKNNSFNKTGIGIDTARQPLKVVNFLIENQLSGRILNSIGFGGWLSWELKQPVFIDGRLEVMQEEIYKEITDSWYNGLPGLVRRHHPDLVVYNYLTYYPWTLQLAGMAEWRLIYIDGIAAVYARPGYAMGVQSIEITELPVVGESAAGGGVIAWAKGFYMPVDYLLIERQHKAYFRLQASSVFTSPGCTEAIRFYNSGNEKYRLGSVHSAIVDLTRAIELKPDYVRALNNRAIILATELKDFNAAFADFDRILEIDPLYSDAWLGRGTAFFLQSKKDSACANWQKAAVMGNSRAERLIRLHCNRK